MPTLTPTYAVTQAQTGYGDVVFISVDGGTTYTQIMQTRKIAYSNQKKDFVDTTTTTSTGGYKTSKGALKDPGSFTFDMVFLPGDPGQIALAAAYDANTVLTVKHVYKPSGSQTTGPIKTFTAEVEQCPHPGSDETNVAQMSVSLKISGPIVTTPGA